MGTIIKTGMINGELYEYKYNPEERKNKRDNKTGSALSNVTENITNMMVAIIPLIVIVGIMSGIISAMDFNNTKHKPIKMKQKRKVVRKVINETAQIILKEPEVKQITHPMMEDYILIKLGKDMELVLEMERQEKLHPEQECMIEEFLPEFKKEHNLEGHYGLFQQRK